MSSLLCRAGPPATELLRPHPCPVQTWSGQTLVCNINIRYFHNILSLQEHAALFLPPSPPLSCFAASVLFLSGPPCFSSQFLHPLHTPVCLAIPLPSAAPPSTACRSPPPRRKRGLTLG